MRPIKLTMTAFGPYKEIECIDFRELGDRNLFLITGPTGAGKTTIFDAISFAIYGEASGTTRPSDSLRSHFSEDDRLTEVELEFELKGITYHIHRIPKQLKPKTKGEGYTEQKPEATLTVYSGDKNSVIVGVKNVNDKIEGVLGINAEQFKQIMMIPQGEFQKLLTSSTEEREKVLQQLFDTSLYNVVQTKLDMQAKSLYGDIRKNKELRDHDIARIDPAGNALLAELIHAEDKHIAEILERTQTQVQIDIAENQKIEASIVALSQNIESQIALREKTRENNDKLSLKEATQLRLEAKEQASTVMDQLNRVVQKAERALSIAPVEEHVNSRIKELKDKQTEYATVLGFMDEARQKVIEAEAGYAEESTPESIEARQTYIAERARLSALKEKVTKIDDLVRTIAQAEVTCKNIELSKTAQQTLIQIETQRLESLRHKSLEVKEAEVLAARQKQSLDQGMELGRKMKKLLELQTEQIRLSHNLNEQQKAVETLHQKVKSAEQLYKKSKLDALLNQAAALAKDLQEGDSCPVCGSTHHPLPATFKGEALSEEALTMLEKALKEAEEQYNKGNRNLGVLETQIHEGLKNRSDYLNDISAALPITLEKLPEEMLLESLQQLLKAQSNVVKGLQKEVEDLESKALQYPIYIQKIAEGSEKIKGLEAKVNLLTEELMRSTNALIQDQAGLKHIYEEVPERIRSSESLEKAIGEQVILQKEAEDRLNSAQKALEEARNQQLSLETSRNQLSKDIISLQDTLAKAQSTLEVQIKGAGFEDIEDYRQASLSSEKINDYKLQIENHHKECHALKEQLEELIRTTQNIEKIDLTTFEETIGALRSEASQLEGSKSAVFHRIQNNSSIVKAVEDINLEMRDRETLYKIVGNLANAAKGFNKERITFERYVLAAFLEDIITAANVRLSQMTGGRYKLSRTAELQRSNAKGGLELEVFDNYTGKSRHVKTLSGGEGFKASLAMALGLSDIVQSYAGGVQLDTMFIDEGFGTLDQESLDSAISCLIDLQKTGRLVGIISHVQELKERVDTRLEVFGGAEGSWSRFAL